MNATERGVGGRNCAAERLERWPFNSVAPISIDLFTDTAAILY